MIWPPLARVAARCKHLLSVCDTSFNVSPCSKSNVLFVAASAVAARDIINWHLYVANRGALA